MLNSLKGFIVNAQTMLPVTGAALCQQFFDMASRINSQTIYAYSFLYATIDTTHG